MTDINIRLNDELFSRLLPGSQWMTCIINVLEAGEIGMLEAKPEDNLLCQDGVVLNVIEVARTEETFGVSFSVTRNA